MTENTDPSHLIPILPREQLLENLLGPLRVLLGYTCMPAIQQIEFDGDDVPFAPRCERMIKVPGVLKRQRSAVEQTLW